MITNETNNYQSSKEMDVSKFLRATVQQLTMCIIMHSHLKTEQLTTGNYIYSTICDL